MPGRDMAGVLGVVFSEKGSILLYLGPYDNPYTEGEFRKIVERHGCRSTKSCLSSRCGWLDLAEHLHKTRLKWIGAAFVMMAKKNRAKARMQRLLRTEA